MAQKTQTQIIDVNGFQANDIGTGAKVQEGGLGVWTQNLIKQMEGDWYTAPHFRPAVALNNEQYYRLLSIATRKISLSIRPTNAAVRVRIYQAPTLTANGAVLVAAPHNFGVDLNTNFVWQGPTITLNGTVRFDDLAGSLRDFAFEIQAGIEYLIRVTNLSAANNIAFNIGTFI